MEHAIPNPAPPPVIEDSTERIAWGVLLVAFAIFCAACILSTLAVYVFLFQSTQQMRVVSQSARGNFGFTGADLRESLVRDNPQEMVIGSTVRPSDSVAQATIMVRDPIRAERVIASLTLKGNTSAATLRAADAPRFDWSNARYNIAFNIEGEVDILVTDDLGRDLSLEVFTRSGVYIALGRPGLYTVTAGDTLVSLAAHRGAGVLTPPGARIGWPVSAGAVSSVRIGSGDDTVVTQPLPVNLLQNSALLVDNLTRPEGAEVEVVGPSLWGCGHTNALIASPQPGRFFAVHQDGRDAIRMVRGDGALHNGQTYCLQGRESRRRWQEIAQYNWLSLRMTFNIENQSLSACGTTEEATECPLMLVIEYIDEDGIDRQFVFGFYAMFDPSRNNRLQCPACHQQHIFVQRGVWYTYESGNLFDLPVQARPVALTKVRFYASGHEYDVRVSEVSLLADTRPQQDNEQDTTALR